MKRKSAAPIAIDDAKGMSMTSENEKTDTTTTADARKRMRQETGKLEDNMDVDMLEEVVLSTSFREHAYRDVPDDEIRDVQGFDQSDISIKAMAHSKSYRTEPVYLARSVTSGSIQSNLSSFLIQEFARIETKSIYHLKDYTTPNTDSTG